MRPFLFLSHTGCLLPLLIVFNLCFGWIFFKLGHWLLIELILILLFVLNSIIITRKIFSHSRKRDDAIDVEAEVVQEREKLK